MTPKNRDVLTDSLLASDIQFDYRRCLLAYHGSNTYARACKNLISQTTIVVLSIIYQRALRRRLFIDVSFSNE
ncbi:hypothetical protein [Dulcicalothrix desertica]|uniref:hypothetical protein n=1 Tax=Dulcicalothrix desertica TaxID=32056 RepID=UPI000F8DD0E1|nr:hypothetical protein [Dulcicalothrix desertica]